ncbi:ABC transporter ATP-binding protein [Lactobacillus acidophilus]|uniref:ATP-binding cassette domain-containing protein n=1 Tax=Lactobacillus acidophilus TaxID=1579 RepID=UPI000F75321F|nr:ABC transporter ATP-binding protein [Lactobacillus acidophilus]AZN75748.1 ABC transporter ATP-binding protein [Lactobacillus acidophilus]
MTITINTLTFSYEKDPIIYQLNTEIPTGFSLLIGPTGCGKSTLLKILAGLYPKYAGKMTGSINLHQQKAAMMFQNAAEQFTMATPREEIIFALENLQTTPDQFQVKLNTAVEFTQIADLLDQKINTMSGGQQQRVALAVLLAMDVDVLLLDEPFASCDPETRSFLIDKLALLAKSGKTIILSDHVLKGYDSVCDYVFKFENKIIKELSVSEKEKLFIENEKEHDHHYSFSLPQGEPVFKLKNTQIFQNRRLLNQTELFIYPKATLITGPNGVGKTSLFKAMTQMIPYSGSFTYYDQEIAKLRPRKYLMHVAQIFQKASDQFLMVSVKDEIELSKKDRNSFFTDEKIDEWLTKLGLADHLDQVVYTLSGGQQKKLQILLMLMTKHNVLLIDEPLSGLDQQSIYLVLTLMRESQKQLNQTFLIISHQIDTLAKFCPYRLVFDQQQLKYVER